MLQSDYFPLNRKLHLNPIWTAEKFTRGQAWVDMLMLTNYTCGIIRVHGVALEVPRGYLGWSQLKLAERWKWSRGKLSRFVSELQKMDMITVHQKGKLTTLIQITNYEYYNGTVQQTEQQTEQQTDNKQDTNKKVKKEKKETLPNEKTIRPIPDCIEKQIVLWWSVAYEKIEERPYQIAWKRDMDCAKKLMEICKGNKKDAILAGCQLLNDPREEFKTFTNLGNGYWNRRPKAYDEMAMQFIDQGIFPPMGITLKDWLTEKINGANNQ